jgi:hypothetical protein
LLAALKSLLRPRRPATLPEAAPLPLPLPVAYLIDQLWCDAHGLYLRGWAHAFAHPVHRLVFASGADTQTLEAFHSRPDLLKFFPQHPHVADTGFEVYLPFAPFRPVRMTLVTDAGAAEVDIAVPPHLIAAAQASAEIPGPPREAFLAAMRERGGTVLEIGARAVGDQTASVAAALGPACRFIGFDIHAAPGVDIVGDAHALSQYVEPGTVDGVMSEAVLEHLQVPWLVAAQINRVLRVGGLTLHIVPHTWPVHEQPNDFWRMSDEGLKVLFGPATGFEVVASGMADPNAIIPPLHRRVGSWCVMPTLPGYGAAYVLARKVADLPGDAVRWPAAPGQIAARSRAYPGH